MKKFDGKKHDYEKYYYPLEDPESEEQLTKAKNIISLVKKNNEIFAKEIMRPEVIEKHLKGQTP